MKCVPLCGIGKRKTQKDSRTDMIFEKVDLYEYFGLRRKSNEKGILTVYARPLHGEEPQDKRRPAMLVLPGGGYKFVSAREGECVALEWLQRGYNAFVLDYSVSPNCYPVQLVEATMAMLYIRQTADKFATDKKHVACVGFSAGAHLCAMLSSIATNCDVTVLGEKLRKAQPDAVVLCYGVLSLAQADKGNSNTFAVVSDNFRVSGDSVDPVSLVSEQTSPAFLWHTRTDGTVSFKNSVDYAMQLQKYGVPFELHVFCNGPHGLSLATKETTCNDEKVGVCVSVWVQLAANWLSQTQGFEIKYKQNKGQ